MRSFNMDLQKLIEEIDENYYKENNYYLSLLSPETFAKQVALEFGKQCFEAGYYAGNYKCRMSKGSAIMNNIISEDFEKYLKNLENDNT